VGRGQVGPGGEQSDLRRVRERREILSGGARPGHVPQRQARVDQGGQQQGCRDRAVRRTAKATLEQRHGLPGPAVGDPQQGERSQRGGMLLPPGEQVLGLRQPSLLDTQLRE
jgi:hypothetical protein